MEPKMIEKVGTCPFCLQGRIVQIPEDEWKESGQIGVDQEAMRSCNCLEGKDARERLKAFDNCEQNIREMIGKKWPEVADLLNEAKGMVYGEGLIKKIQITLPGGDGIVSLSFGSTGLKLTHRKVLQTELSSGY